MSATAVLGLVAGAFVAAYATYEGRQARGYARGPVLATSGEQPLALHSRYWDSFRGRQFSVVVIAPLTGSAPLPPGVRSWPRPGEVLLSPALADAPEAEDFRGRWGTVAGLIGAAGLASPGERIAYVRPTQEMLSTSSLTPITGFGSSTGAGFGDPKNVAPRWMILTAMASLLFFPAVAFAVLAARVGAAGRDRRDARLRMLGAGFRARVRLDRGEAIPSVLAGAGLAAALSAVALTTDVRLPWIDYTLAAADLRRDAAALFGAIAATVPAMLLLACGRHPAVGHRRASARRRVVPVVRLRTAAAIAFPLFVLLAFASRHLFDGFQSSSVAYLACAAGAWTTLPAVTGWLTGRIGRRATAAARRSGDLSQLIAARTAAARPGAVVRLTAALVFAIAVVGQGQLIGSMLSSRSGTAAQLHSAEGRSMALVQASPRALLDGAFVAALPEGAHVVSQGELPDAASGGPGARVIQAPCPDLTALGLPCPAEGQTVTIAHRDLDTRFRHLNFSPDGSTPTLVRTGPLAKLAADGTLWTTVFDSPDHPLDLAAVKRAAHLHLSTKANVRPLAEAGGSSFENGYRARWAPFLGAIGALVLLGAMLLVATSEFVEFAAALAPLVVLTGHTRIYRDLASWMLGMPLALAGVVGVTGYVVIAQPVVDAEHGARVSFALVLAALAGSAALAALATWAGARAAARHSRTWRPRAR
ncbi:hypothetical protein [Streptomyces sp. CBMA156]|uniref:hypothetical protein n=1 Tax=Streptomyces sp. CBMA156 TaxID=1930280 RepID=UPI001661FAC2|nr:hypothetical protein [Streptomyces sp. CBMA156]MBD0673722.1 hypothetical protein [Streptomyces sp. CBMA156]